MSLAATCSVSSTIGRRESPSRAPLTRVRAPSCRKRVFQHVVSALGCEEGLPLVSMRLGRRIEVRAYPPSHGLSRLSRTARPCSAEAEREQCVRGRTEDARSRATAYSHGGPEPARQLRAAH
jgi:hypothetical protein